MSEIKLKPCPHCGSINLEFTDMHDLEECGNFDTDYCPCNEYDSTAHCAYTSVVCTVQKGGCGASSGYYLTKEEAAEAWNRRAGGQKMSDDLISRKAVIDTIENIISEVGVGLTECLLKEARVRIEQLDTAFDKEKIIEELKSWEKASHDAGIQSTYAELDNKASGYYQESRAYHRAIEIVEKGGTE